MIAGLEELVLRCSDENSRANIREAVKCYEGGAYRAAIVTCYVAVCFDLIEKLRILAAAGDLEAKKNLIALEKLQDRQKNNDPKAISGLLDFERSLLELFRDKFDFFGMHEFEDLSRLRQDRNRCAHPSFLHSSQPYSPTAELARLHIFNAITTVLAQSPRQGKAALENLRAVILSQNFPSTKDDAIERLKGSELSNARAALTRAFVDELTFGWPDKASPYYKLVATTHALLAVVEINRSVAVPRVTAAMEKLLMSPDEDALRYGAVIALRVPDAGENASEPSRTVLKQFLQNPKTLNRANAIRYASKISWLKQTAIESAGTLTSLEIARAKGGMPDEVVSRAVDLFATAKSWDEANDIFPKIVLPYISRLTITHIENILSAAESGRADLLGSGAFKQFLRKIADKNPITSGDLTSLLKRFGLEKYDPDILDPESEDENE